MKTAFLTMALAALLVANASAADTQRPVLSALHLYRSCNGGGAVVDHCRAYLGSLHNMRNVNLTDDRPVHCRAGAFSSETLRVAFVSWMDDRIGDREVMEMPANAAAWQSWIELIFKPIGCARGYD